MTTDQNFKKTNEKTFINSAIRVPNVLVIMDDGTNIGVISTQEALKMAVDAGLDLVQVSPPTGGRPPTCKIIDYGRFKYDESKKIKAANKKQREMAVEIKEIKFRPVTGEFDLKTKARKANEFLNEGHQVKATIVFKGRELSHKEVALDTLDLFVSYIPDAVIVSQGSIENNKFLSVFIGKKN